MVMLPWVMPFQLEGVYLRSGGRPRKVAMILRWTDKDWALHNHRDNRIRTVSTVEMQIVRWYDNLR